MKCTRVQVDQLIEEDCRCILQERLTFDQLFALSEPKRVVRSRTVRGPPLSLDASEGVVYYLFNYKSYPSTTGKRWRGYIKFFKPKKQVPLEKVECIVDCGCPDFKYRWAWANKQRGSGVVGSNSLNQAFNRAPRITNPSNRPGLCKHILAVRDFIYGQVETFKGKGDTSAKLNKIVKDVQAQAVKDKADASLAPPKNWLSNSEPDAVSPKPNKLSSVSNKLPTAAKNQLTQRFNKIESVDTSEMITAKEILSEVEAIQVDSDGPGAEEALNVLRDIRNLLMQLAGLDDSAAPLDVTDDDTPDDDSDSDEIGDSLPALPELAKGNEQ